MAMHVVHHYSHALIYILKITSRWLPILLQEGVWSKPVVPCVLLVYSLTWPCMLSITTAMHSRYILKITSRWLPILLQEGVWSKPVVPCSRVSAPVYCWCIASHGYACCLFALTLHIKNNHKMAAYHTPGRGVRKTCGTLK